jgi:dTDP-4-amino-4,6-dideoxygalactose transaminase
MATFTGAQKAVVCVNGTNALHLALMLVGVQPGDEVITQSLTFIATANAIHYCGAHPVFLDIDQDTLGLSPTAVQTFLDTQTEQRADGCYNKGTGRRIAACLPMHTFGHPCRIDELVAISERYHIELVEDAAESLGSWYKGRHTGTFSKIGVLSFNGNKILTTGGGGMLLFNDEALAKRTTSPPKPKYPIPGNLYTMKLDITTACPTSMPHWGWLSWNNSAPSWRPNVPWLRPTGLTLANWAFLSSPNPNMPLPTTG